MLPPHHKLNNDRFLRALMRQPVDRTPVWVMRQAGRYLPEYRKVRAQAGSFMSLCQNPELACEVTLQPLARYDLDAAILFSDILTVPDALGLGLYFVEGEGPKFERPIISKADVQRLAVPDVSDELGYVTDAVSTIRQALAGCVPLIGFAGSPWTVATYAVEGGSSKTFSKIKGMMFEQPALLHNVLEVITRTTIDYLNAQIAAGAQAVMVFDTWGGVLSEAHYEQFSLWYMQRIVDGLSKVSEGREVPIVLFTKNGGQWLEKMARTGCHGVGLDWTTELDNARMRVGDTVALQGNLDPCVLYASPDAIREEVKQVLAKFGQGSGHVFNLGHGIHPTINPEYMKAMIEAVHEFSPAYHN